MMLDWIGGLTMGQRLIGVAVTMLLCLSIEIVAFTQIRKANQEIKKSKVSASIKGKDAKDIQAFALQSPDEQAFELLATSGKIPVPPQDDFLRK